MFHKPAWVYSPNVSGNFMTDDNQSKKSFKDFYYKGLFKFYRIKNGIVSTKINWEKILIRTITIIALGSIVSGLIIFISFIYKLSHNYSISSNEVIIDKSGQVGDFIGGVVGSVWSLTGVLLFYVTLQLQRRELAENRKHFQMSRLTDIIYKQLSLFNPVFKKFELKDSKLDELGIQNKYKGQYAFSYLRKNFEEIAKMFNDKEVDEAKKKAAYDLYIHQYAIVEINKAALLELYEELGNQIDTVRAVLIKDGIPPEDLNELKAIFFRNLGREFLNCSDLLLMTVKGYIDLKKKTTADWDYYLSIEFQLQIKLESITGFRNETYTKEKIRHYLLDRDIYNYHKV